MEDIRRQNLNQISENELFQEIENFSKSYLQENTINWKTYLGLDFDSECENIINLLFQNFNNISAPNFKNLLKNLNHINEKIEVWENINELISCIILPQEIFKNFDTKKVEILILDYFYQLYWYLVLSVSWEENLKEFLENYKIEQNLENKEHIKSYRLALVLSTKNFYN